MEKRLVIGLGNPGPEYEHTWHNLGFRIIRYLAKRLQTSLKRKGSALLGKGRYAGLEVTLLMPLSYMNLSGVSTARVARKIGVFEDEIMVVLDDHDLPRGLLRMRSSGGDGGHRGLRSVLYELGTNAVPRLRVGIRDEKSDPEVGGYDDLADRVLEPLSAREEMHLDQMAEGAANAVLDWLRTDIKTAMNRHNNRRFELPEENKSEGNHPSATDFEDKSVTK